MSNSGCEQKANDKVLDRNEYPGSAIPDRVALPNLQMILYLTVIDGKALRLPSDV